MQMLIVHNIWAVGMHHWGPRELMIGAGYNLIKDENNPHDVNAVCVKDGCRTMAYVKRDQSQMLTKLLSFNLFSRWLLKPKDFSQVRNRRTGPQQRSLV